MDTLLQLINDKLAQLNQEKNSLSSQVDESFNKVESEIQRVMNNPTDIGQISAEEINEVLNCFGVDDIAKIKMYKLVIKNGLISNSDEDTKEMVEIFSKANSALQKKKEELQVNKELEEQIEKYKNIKSKIEELAKNKFVNPEDIDLIGDILVEFGMEPMKAAEYIVAITKTSVNTIINSNSSDEEIVEAEETNLNKKDVEKLFEKYNYDFTKLEEENQEMILKYGKLDTMEGIFQALVSIGKWLDLKNNIALQNSFTRILTFSNKDIFLEVLNKVKTDYENNYDIKSTNSLDYFYSEILTKYEVFVKGSKKTKTRKKYDIKKNTDKEPHGPDGGPDDPPPQEEVIYGRKDDFNEICNELDKLNIQLTYVIAKVPTILTFTYNHFKRNLDELELYGIDVDKYRKALSHVVASPDISGSIDAHIENGLFDYLLENMSSISRVPYDYVFYRVKRANQLNGSSEHEAKIPIFSEFHKKRLCLDSNITDRHREVMKIEPKNKKKSNGADIVGQYDIVFPQFKDIDVKNARGPIVFAENHPLITELDVFRPEEYGDATKMANYYEIDGIRISRIKVLRIFEELIKKGLDSEPDSVLFAMTRNSILTEKEVTTLSMAIRNLYSKGIGGK